MLHILFNLVVVLSAFFHTFVYISANWHNTNSMSLRYFLCITPTDMKKTHTMYFNTKEILKMPGTDYSLKYCHCCLQPLCHMCSQTTITNFSFYSSLFQHCCGRNKCNKIMFYARPCIWMTNCFNQLCFVPFTLTYFTCCVQCHCEVYFLYVLLSAVCKLKTGATICRIPTAIYLLQAHAEDRVVKFMAASIQPAISLGPGTVPLVQSKPWRAQISFSCNYLHHLPLGTQSNC